MPERLRVLTWQVHGNYLWYLAQAPHDFVLVTRPGHPPGYAGRTASFPWPDNVHEVAEAELPALDADCVLYQSRGHWQQDRPRLPPRLRQAPAIYLEHDPPQQHPTNTRHWAEDADLLVHVTPFNALMWDSGAVPTRIIEHGVTVPAGVRYRGDRPQGLVVINNLYRRGRRLGADVYECAQAQVPLALAGMDSNGRPGGIGEIPNMALAEVMAQFRFLFNPIRWSSLGLSLAEAMTVGLPVVALATTEVASVIRNGENGWCDTRLPRLIAIMHELIAEPALARRWGEGARATALARFAIDRFVRDWDAALRFATGAARARTPARMDAAC